MCRDCWVDAGSPGHRSPDIDRAVVLIDRIYSTEPTGAPLHVELDDWNLDVTWSPYAEGRDSLSDPPAWDAAIELAELMNHLPISDRAAAVAWAQGYIDGREWWHRRSSCPGVIR